MGKNKNKRNPRSNHAVKESNSNKLDETSTKSDEQNQQLSMQNDLMKERISRLEEEVKKLNKMLVSSADELGDSKKRHQEEILISQSLQENLQGTYCELQQSNHTANTLSDQKAALVTESEQLHKEIKVLTNEKLNLQETNQKQKDLICQEQNKAAVFFQHNELMRAQLNDFKNADEIARKDIASLKGNVNALVAVKDTFQSENQAQKKKIFGLEEEIRRLQKINEEQATECIELVASKSSENAIRISEMDIRITQYTQRIAKLKTKLKTQEVDFTQFQQHLLEDMSQKNMQIDELHQQMKDNLNTKDLEIQSLIEEATKQGKGILALNKMMEESNRVKEDMQNENAFRKNHTEILRSQMEIKQCRKLLHFLPLPKKWLLNRKDVLQKLDVIAQGVPGFKASQNPKQKSSKQTLKN